MHVILLLALCDGRVLEWISAAQWFLSRVVFITLVHDVVDPGYLGLPQLRTPSTRPDVASRLPHDMSQVT